MAVAGGLDLHRGQLTFDHVDLGTGEALPHVGDAQNWRIWPFVFGQSIGWPAAPSRRSGRTDSGGPRVSQAMKRVLSQELRPSDS